jgi:hypothetical protein
MATWKKVIVSGSAASLASLTLDTDLAVAHGGTGASTLTSGEFLVGNGTSAVTTVGSTGSGNVVRASGATLTTVNAGGSFSGSFQGNGSLLTGVSATSLDIDAFGTDLTGITVALTDKLPLSDAGTEGRINVSQLAAPMAGTGLEASAGTLRIAGAAAGAGLTGGAGSALAVGAGTHITVNADDIAVNTTTLLPALSGSIFAKVSGDITITAAGVATIGANAVAIGTDVSGLGTGTSTALANAVGSAGSFVVNGGALGTPASGTLTNATGLPVSSGISGLGTGIATALAVNVGSAGAPVLFNGAGGTPSSLTLTNATGLPVGSITGLGSGVATFLATPTSANLASAITNETGTGTLVFSADPTFTGTVNAAAVTTSGTLTVGGDLVVNGTTTTVNTSNIQLEDRFVILNYGSGSISPTAEGGIIVEGGTAGSGQAFYYDGNDSRWAVNTNASGTATSLTATAYAAIAFSGTTASATSAGFDKLGNIVADGTDVYIYG